MFTRHRAPVWRWEQGHGYDLRQYDGDRPTGLVALVRHEDDHHDPRYVEGIDAVVIHEPGCLLVLELRPDRTARRLRIPLHALLSVDVTAERGLPGCALVRLTMTARSASVGVFTAPVWFPASARPALDQFVREVGTRPTSAWRPAPPAPAPVRRITGRTTTAPERSDPSGEPGVRPLTAAEAPRGEDWVVFRAAPDHEALFTRPREAST